RGLGVVGVQDAVGERQHGRQDRVLYVGQQQVGQQQPRRPARPRRVGTHHDVPEQQGGGEEAEMLEVVPARRAQRDLVDRRDVPEPGGGDEEEPRRGRLRQPAEQGPQRGGAQQRGGPVGAERARQAAQQRQ